MNDLRFKSNTMHEVNGNTQELPKKKKRTQGRRKKRRKNQQYREKKEKKLSKGVGVWMVANEGKIRNFDKFKKIKSNILIKIQPTRFYRI